MAVQLPPQRLIAAGGYEGYKVLLDQILTFQDRGSWFRKQETIDIHFWKLPIWGKEIEQQNHFTMEEAYRKGLKDAQKPIKTTNKNICQFYTYRHIGDPDHLINSSCSFFQKRASKSWQKYESNVKWWSLDQDIFMPVCCKRIRWPQWTTQFGYIYAPREGAGSQTISERHK